MNSRLVLASAALCGAIGAQQQTARLVFEVATLKAVPGAVRGAQMKGGPGTTDPSRFSWQTTLLVLTSYAYSTNSDQVVGPEWMRDSFYSISANIPENTNSKQFHEMLQNLLADRMRLSIHREVRTAQGYDLVIAKGGPKMKPVVAEPGSERGGGHFGPDGAVLDFKSAPMQSIVRTLQMRAGFDTGAGGPVRITDKTGLTGTYDATLKYSLREDDASQPDLMDAIQSQLGLRLVPTKISLEMIVIDHAEKTPLGN